MNFPLAVRVLLACLSISRRTPTCSDVDCYARRIAPYTLTCCCKSFIENVEVFSREGGGGGERVLPPRLAPSFVLFSWPGARRAPRFRSRLQGSAEGGRKGREDYGTNAVTTRRTWGSRKQTFPFQSALSFVCLNQLLFFSALKSERGFCYCDVVNSYLQEGSQRFRGGARCE